MHIHFTISCITHDAEAFMHFLYLIFASWIFKNSDRYCYIQKDQYFGLAACQQANFSVEICSVFFFLLLFASSFYCNVWFVDHF